MLSLAAVGIANAGQIQLGSNQGANGLTSTYVTGTNTCAATYVVNNGPAAAGCVSGGVANATSGRSFVLSPFIGSIFNGQKLNGADPAFPTGQLSTTDSSGSAVSFASINDGSTSHNAWAGYGGTGATSVTIPVGIYAVDSVWTMLNDYWGTTGGQQTSVVFNFGNTPGQTSGYDTITYVLTNGVEIRDANDCSGVSTYPAPGTNPNRYNNPATCTTFATTTSSSITKDGAWSSLYNGNTISGSMYYNTSGTLNLDNQHFSFSGAQLSEYLVSIEVINTLGTKSTSQTALTAITVDSLTASTPEPSTVMLLLSGLGVIGFRRFRRS
ncbi:MAG TPA: PEP-CTERM sorting domain-containing protein [Bryobacteraceae bacterium]|nr:PEP-CTERM sorting domain-containing protein [Bryobacteraceae bacterium]